MTLQTTAYSLRKVGHTLWPQLTASMYLRWPMPTRMLCVWLSSPRVPRLAPVLRDSGHRVLGGARESHINGVYRQDPGNTLPDPCRAFRLLQVRGLSEGVFQDLRNCLLDLPIRDQLPCRQFHCNLCLQVCQVQASGCHICNPDPCCDRGVLYVTQNN